MTTGLKLNVLLSTRPETKSAAATHQLTLHLIFTLQLTVQILQVIFQRLSLLT